MQPCRTRSLYVIGLALILAFAGCGDRPHGQNSAADNGTRAVHPQQPPTATATDPTTGTDPAGRPSGPSGGTTGADNARTENRAGAGGETSAATAGQDSPAPNAASKK